MHLTKEDIRKIVVESGVATDDEINVAENESLRSGRPLFEVLIGRGVISEQIFYEGLSQYLHVPLVHIEKVSLKPEIVERIPESYAKSRGVVLFAFDDAAARGSLGMIDPEDFGTIIYLRKKLNAWLDVYLLTSPHLKHALRTYKRKISEDFNKIIEDNLRASEGMSETGNITKIVEAIPIVTILDNIIEHAVVLDASDIHFEPFQDKLLVRYRIDGILHEIISLPSDLTPIFIARIKVIANLQIDIHSAPQDGRFRFPLEDQFIDVRVSVVPTFHGEKGEMRLLKGSLRPLSLHELGLPAHDLERLTEAIHRPHGLILVTGPTGSGKTTTQYAILEVLNTSKVNITTIEDPIEYNIPRVNQTQVNVKAGYTFVTGLRALVRQNPDIIMIGEIRDIETADIAVNAALTGHLLLSTLHTNDAPTAIPRLIDLGIQPFLLASTLNVVVAQRLVRRLCTVCVSSRKIDEPMKKLIEGQLQKLNPDAANNSLEVPHIIYVPKGCAACNFSGYRSQIGIFEVLYISDAIRELILQNAPTHLILKTARSEGMKTLFEDGLEKIAAGFTSIEEVSRVSGE